MGCQNSKGKHTQSQRKISDAQHTTKTISKKNRKIVQKMWSECERNSKAFGIALFIRMFDEKPELQQLFYDFKDLTDQDELMKSLEELDHVARVMNAFGSCIEILGDINQFEDAVQRIGVAHIKIGLKMEDLEVFARLLIEKLSEVYESSWTIDHEHAWTEFLGLLAANFAIGLHVNLSRKEALSEI